MTRAQVQAHRIAAGLMPQASRALKVHLRDFTPNTDQVAACHVSGAVLATTAPDMVTCWKCRALAARRWS